MTARITLIALTGAAVIAGAAGCGKSGGPASTPTPTPSNNASITPAWTNRSNGASIINSSRAASATLT